jgi:starch synthase
MASGTPVLATRIGGMPEIVDEGRTGFLVNPDSVPEIVSILEQCMQRPETLAAMGEESQREAVAYSPAAMAKQYSVLYKAVLQADPAVANKRSRG